MERLGERLAEARRALVTLEELVQRRQRSVVEREHEAAWTITHPSVRFDDTIHSGSARVPES